MTTKSLAAVARSNAVAVAYVDAIVMGGGLSDRPCRGRGYLYRYSATDKEQ